MNTVIAFNTHGCLDESQVFEPIRAEFQANSNHIDVKNGGLTVHMFDRLTRSDGSIEDDIDVVMTVTESLSRVFNLGSRQRISLRKGIERTISDDAYKCDGIRAVGKYLRLENTPTAEGVYDKMYCLFGHNIFRDGDLFIKRGRINVVDMGHLDGNTQVIVIELVLSYIWRLANAGQLDEFGDIYLFIDEVQNISFASCGMLSLLLSEGRKYHLNLILATQLLNYNTTNPTQRKMLQAGLVLYFKPADSDRAATAAMISEIDKDAWSMELSLLEVGEFVASGPLLIGDVATAGPLTIDGRLNATINRSKKVIIRHNEAVDYEQLRNNLVKHSKEVTENK